MTVVQGRSASPGQASGRALIVRTIEDCLRISGQEVVIMRASNPELIVAAVGARAVVADFGGVGSHLAIIARELGMPCVVGTEVVMSLITDGVHVTVDGEFGTVSW